MPPGDKWEVYLPAELCFFPNQRIAGKFLGGIAVGKMKRDLTKEGEELRTVLGAVCVRVVNG